MSSRGKEYSKAIVTYLAALDILAMLIPEIIPSSLSLHIMVSNLQHGFFSVNRSLLILASSGLGGK